MDTMDAKRYRLAGDKPRTLAAGNTLAPGDEVTLTGEECEQLDNAWLVAEGLLVEVADEAPEADVEEPAEEPAPTRRKRGSKAGAGDTAVTDTDDEAAAQPTGDDDTNGGTDR